MVTSCSFFTVKIQRKAATRSVAQGAQHQPHRAFHSASCFRFTSVLWLLRLQMSPCSISLTRASHIVVLSLKGRLEQE